MKKEKDFEVLITPTDVLAQELEDVLGGNGSECWIKVDCFVQIRAEKDEECPVGMHVVDGYCVPID